MACCTPDRLAALVLLGLPGALAAGFCMAATQAASEPQRLEPGQFSATPSTQGVVPESSIRLAQVAAPPRPQTSTAPPATIGERPATPTADEIALRDQRVLLKRGAATVDVGVAYSYSEQVPLLGLRVEQRSASATAALRYGLLDDVQITARVPRTWQRTSVFVDQTPNPNSSAALPPPLTVTRGSFTGDASMALLGVALREAVGRPNVILSLDAVLPSGPGDRGLGAGLVLSKSYDPAVVFAGLSYLRGRSIDPANARRSLARHNLGMSLGYTYAVNDSLALNTVFVATYRNSQSPDGVSIPSPRERHQLQLGMTWMVARGLFVEPAVAMRLGGVSPDMSFSLNVPYSF
ncbi:MAG: hypothetical protein WA210_23530 [Burkholderiaceae bacterium]